MWDLAIWRDMSAHKEASNLLLSTKINLQYMYS